MEKIVRLNSTVEEPTMICFNTDVDGVLIPGQELMDEYVYNEIDVIASDRYRYELLAHLSKLNERKEELEAEQRFTCPEMEEIKKEIVEYEKRKLIHFDHKNMTLEEATPELEGRIPYHKIYQLENMYPGVAEILYKIHELGIFDEENAPTLVNPVSEIRAKNEFFHKNFPWIKVVPLKFFVEPYFMPGSKLKTLNRVPCDKATKFAELKPKMIIPKSPYVEDTLSIVKIAQSLGFPAYFRSRDDDPVDVYIRAVNETIDRDFKDKVKKLSR